MSRAGRLLRNPWIVIPLALAIAGGIVVAAVALHIPDPKISPALAQRKPDVAHGAYLAVVGDCTSCHTAPGGKPFAGGTPFPTPVGTIYASNITPDRETGIGNFSFPDFVRVMRFGVAPRRTRLYPAMPYPSYAKVSDEDLQDLFAYLQHDVASVRQAARANQIPWPLDIRWPLAFWNILFLDDTDFVADASENGRWNRGAYLVQGLAHCGACHTPRGLAMQEKALTGNDGTAYLSGGGAVDNWIPSSLRSEHGGGLADWSEDDIAQLLKTGRNSRSAVFGSMTAVVLHSTQHMSGEDIAAIAAYLKSLGPNKTADRYVYKDGVAEALFAGDASAPGAQIYVDRCAGCHRTTGKGVDGVFPPLAGNPLLQSDKPASAIRIVLSGSTLPATKTAPSSFTMAPYADLLTDQDIADVVTFIQTSWGNAGTMTTAAAVARLRKGAQ
jgi:mono/diheme cytochrome c family protein